MWKAGYNPCLVFRVLLFLVVLAGAAPDGSSAQALSTKQLVFGQSAALTGPAKLFGQSMRLGLFAAFREVNRKGGVHNYRLILESLDDAYEPEAAITNAREFIYRRNVFALIGAVGTSASAATQPLATERGLPYVAPFTGAEFLRVAQLRPNVVNVRASFYQETEEMVVRLTEDLGVQRIGVLYQNDFFRARRTQRIAPRRRSTRPFSCRRGGLSTQHRGDQNRPARPAALAVPRPLSSSAPTNPRRL